MTRSEQEVTVLPPAREGPARSSPTGRVFLLASCKKSPALEDGVHGAPQHLQQRSNTRVADLSAAQLASASDKAIDSIMGAKGLRVAFCHPDLGLGGAERLVVDAATELASRKSKVSRVDVWTAYYDPSRAFEETRGSGGFRVCVAGGWFPRAILGRAMALCAYVRCCLVAFAIAWRCWFGAGYDVVIADQVSVVIPILLLLTRAKVVFYCHFPDQLLAKPRSLLHRAYRAPLNWLEETTTGLAHRVLVNSEFTKMVFAGTFTSLDARGLRPAVLYPAVSVPAEDALEEAQRLPADSLGPGWAEFLAAGEVFLSINRFERKKGLPLAIRALGELRNAQSSRGGGGVGGGGGPRLVLAGGYDSRLKENVEHLEELRAEAQDLGLEPFMRFLPSFTDEQRSLLLNRCDAVLYTPTNEHFGIVPLEAMAARRPVVACNSGGPCESIGRDGSCGLLCDPTPKAFSGAMGSLIGEAGRARASAMGDSARRRVVEGFSRSAFGDRLMSVVEEAVAQCGAVLDMSPLPDRTE